MNALVAGGMDARHDPLYPRNSIAYAGGEDGGPESGGDASRRSRPSSRTGRERPARVGIDALPRSWYFNSTIVAPPRAASTLTTPYYANYAHLIPRRPCT